MVHLLCVDRGSQREGGNLVGILEEKYTVSPKRVVWSNVMLGKQER